MIPDWAMNLPMNLIYQKASDFKLDAHLVAAICFNESGGKQFKTRYEPAYTYMVDTEKFANLLRITQKTEVVMQQMSWGLMQIMGGKAREMGFLEDLPLLTDPATNLHYACKLLADLKKKHDVVDDVVASYNAGSPMKNPDGTYHNQEYVDRVEGFYKQLSGYEFK